MFQSQLLRSGVLLTFLLAVCTAAPTNNTISLGPFLSIAHGCSATEVRIIDENTVEVTNQKYDGAGPNAYYVAGTQGNYTEERPELRPVTILVPEDHTCSKLPAYSGRTVIVKLPKGQRIQDFKYFSIYCLEFNHNFCSVEIPASIQPAPGKSDLETCLPLYIDRPSE